MLEKNYIIKQFEDTLSPKFMRRQKYLRKIENKIQEKKTFQVALFVLEVKAALDNGTSKVLK